MTINPYMSSSQQAQGFAYPTSGYVQPTTTAESVAPAAAATPTAQTSNATTSQTQTRQAAEEARKDRTLVEFMLMLDDYEPLVRAISIGHAIEFEVYDLDSQIPNEVTDYYLQRVGFECEDVRLKRLLSLAAQKFVSDISADAYQHARIRTNATGGRARVNPTPGGGHVKDKTRTTLTMEDLSAALAEYGINSRKPEYYI